MSLLGYSILDSVGLIDFIVGVVSFLVPFINSYNLIPILVLWIVLLEVNKPSLVAIG
mgnify:CR=1 FL=1